MLPPMLGTSRACLVACIFSHFLPFQTFIELFSVCDEMYPFCSLPPPVRYCWRPIVNCCNTHYTTIYCMRERSEQCADAEIGGHMLHPPIILYCVHKKEVIVLRFTYTRAHAPRTNNIGRNIYLYVFRGGAAEQLL